MIVRYKCLMMPKSLVGSLVQFGELNNLIERARYRRDRSKDYRVVSGGGATDT